jgi:hypothetical protein
MSDRFIQVEGHPDLSRDMNSGAIVNRNRTAYDKAKKRAQEAQQSRDDIRTATREINNIKSEMHEIKSLLKELVSKE